MTIEELKLEINNIVRILQNSKDKDPEEAEYLIQMAFTSLSTILKNSKKG